MTIQKAISILERLKEKYCIMCSSQQKLKKETLSQVLYWRLGRNLPLGERHLVVIMTGAFNRFYCFQEQAKLVSYAMVPLLFIHCRN